jgi:DNA-binding response OmpR family regulator
MLPEIDGYELLEYIKPMDIPVIFLTAKGAVHDRIHGLKAGADDYIIKPFQSGEVLARIEAVLRRYFRHWNVLSLICLVICLMEMLKVTEKQNTGVSFR